MDCRGGGGGGRQTRKGTGIAVNGADSDFDFHLITLEGFSRVYYPLTSSSSSFSTIKFAFESPPKESREEEEPRERRRGAIILI